MRRALLLVLVVGCGPSSPAKSAAEAESDYTAELLRCVDQAKTPAESHACRAGVRSEWAPDGGAR